MLRRRPLRVIVADELDGLDDEAREVGVELMLFCLRLSLSCRDRRRQLDLAIIEDVLHGRDLHCEVAALQCIREVMREPAELINTYRGVGDFQCPDFFVNVDRARDLLAIDHTHDRCWLAGL